MKVMKMNVNGMRRFGVHWLVCVCVLAVFATEVPAQIVNNGGANNAMPLLPQMGGMNQQNLTPQQLQSIMQMRALSGRGRRGVQSGFMQNIPLGNPGISAPQIMTPPNGGSSAHKSSSQKRAEAKKLRDTQKHAVRQDEKSKKAKAPKKPRDEQAAK
jgi:hypothetical protein